jgi:alpha-glucosidase
MNSTCSLENNHLRVQVGPHRGSYKAWWPEITIEVHGWPVPGKDIQYAGGVIQAVSNSATHEFHVTIPDGGKGMELTFEQ